MKVSILIPVYNSEKYLSQTIQSALNQTWPDKEIVVVDDGSIDESVDIAQSYAEKGLIKFFQQTNAGACKARNRAFAESTGDYIQYLDADDLLSPDKIEIQIEVLKDKNNSVCNGRWGRFYTNDPFSENIKWGPNQLLQRDLSPIDWLCQNHMSQTSCWLTPRELILKVGGWDETLTQNQDGDFFTRVLAHAEMIYYIDQAKTYYRSNLNNSVSRNANLDKNVRSRFKACESFEKVILSWEDSPRTRLAVANKYQQFVYATFPYYKELTEKAEHKIVDSGGSNWPLDKVGKLSSVLTKVLGWRSVERLKKIARLK